MDAIHRVLSRGVVECRCCAATSRDHGSPPPTRGCRSTTRSPATRSPGCPSAGLDFAAALDYGRRVGGPALRELTFHQRAALLKAVGSLLRENRDELYALSARTGATLGDSKFDVDGGFGVLLAYASKAKRELPNESVYVEGAVEPLSKGGTFVGQHILTPRHGVAVQINAFNFPVWGPLEKFAPAFLAGVPSLVKPASQTAYLTARMVELIIESGLLPEGTLQFVAGSAGDLLDHLTEQDLVAFTGSASTARQLRAHPNGSSGGAVQRRGRLAELLDPRPGRRARHPEFDLYVKALVTEMTVKAGQKCTAIRRAFVPAALVVDAVIEAPRPGWPRSSWSAIRPPRASGWARWPASSSARRCAVAPGAARRGPDRLRRPRARRGHRRRRRPRRVPLADPAAALR